MGAGQGVVTLVQAAVRWIVTDNATATQLGNLLGSSQRAIGRWGVEARGAGIG